MCLPTTLLFADKAKAEVAIASHPKAAHSGSGSASAANLQGSHAPLASTQSVQGRERGGDGQQSLHDLGTSSPVPLTAALGGSKSAVVETRQHEPLSDKK
jgi:hypothetical protein